MRRLALPAWLASLLVVTGWLRGLSTAGDATFAAARAFALAAAVYLLVATVVNVGLALCRVRVRLPLVPLLVVASLSAPLAGTPAFAGTTTTTTTTMMTTTAPTAPPVMHRLGEAAASAPVAPDAPVMAVTPPRAPAPLPAPAPTHDPTVTATTWKVRHGQNFWSIAAHVTRARLGRAPTNAEIVPYWHHLIEVNRSRLVHPSDPSLLYAGQELSLPAD